MKRGDFCCRTGLPPAAALRFGRDVQAERGAGPAVLVLCLPLEPGFGPNVSLRGFTSGLGLYEGNQRLLFCSWNIPASSCWGLGRGVYSRGAPGKRARLLKIGRAGMLAAAQPRLAHGHRTGPTSAPPRRCPHPASTLHGSHLPPVCPSQHPSPGTCCPEPPPSHLSCTEPTQGSVHGLSSPCPSPGPPAVPSQDAARSPRALKTCC